MRSRAKHSTEGPNGRISSALSLKMLAVNLARARRRGRNAVERVQIQPWQRGGRDWQAGLPNMVRQGTILFCRCEPGPAKPHS